MWTGGLLSSLCQAAMLGDTGNTVPQGSTGTLAEAPDSTGVSGRGWGFRYEAIGLQLTAPLLLTAKGKRVFIIPSLVGWSHRADPEIKLEIIACVRKASGAQW